MSENDCKVGPKRSQLLSFEYTAYQVSNFSHSNRPGDENKIRIRTKFPIIRSQCQCLHCRQQLTVSRRSIGLIYKTNPDVLTPILWCQYTRSSDWASVKSVGHKIALAGAGLARRESERLALAARPGLSCPHCTISLRHRPETELFCTGIQVLGSRIFMFSFNVYHATLTIILNDIGHGKHVKTQ